MIFVLTAIEGNFFNAFFDGPLGDQFAHGSRRGLVAAVLDLPLQLTFDRARGNQGLPRLIVNDLGVEILVAAEKAQPRPGGDPLQLIAYAKSTPFTLKSNSLVMLHDSIFLIFRR